MVSPWKVLTEVFELRPEDQTSFRYAQLVRATLFSALLARPHFRSSAKEASSFNAKKAEYSHAKPNPTLLRP